jgi:hypothetical protein
MPTNKMEGWWKEMRNYRKKTACQVEYGLHNRARYVIILGHIRTHSNNSNSHLYRIHYDENVHPIFLRQYRGLRKKSHGKRLQRNRSSKQFNWSWKDTS